MGDQLKKEIESLIETKREGDYWDFKLEHHKNKADLLHDIICMANSRADRDCFIIYGIEDKSFEIKGIENDNNKRTQQNIIDFLKDKPFVGGIRPVVELRAIEIQNHTIDVLVIKNTYDVPYYLTNNYSDGSKNVVYANNIYTRVGDTNTPKRESADINNVEYLWRKRFLLDKPPLVQISEKLKYKKEWKRTDDGYYHIYNPEFRIKIEDDESRKQPEYYAYMMTNEQVSYQTLEVKFYETVLDSFVVVVLDGGRYSAIVPTSEFIHLNNRSLNYDYHFKYYDISSLSWILCNFLFNESDEEEVYARCRLSEIVLFFKDEEEKVNFLEYVKKNHLKLKQLIDQNTTPYSWIESNNSSAHDVIVKEIKTGLALKQMYDKFINLT